MRNEGGGVEQRFVLPIHRWGLMWHVHFENRTDHGAVVVIRCPENSHVLAVHPCRWSTKEASGMVVNFPTSLHGIHHGGLRIDLEEPFGLMEEKTRVYRAVRTSARMVVAERVEQSKETVLMAVRTRSSGATSVDVDEHMTHWPGLHCHIDFAGKNLGYDIRNTRPLEFAAGMHVHDGLGKLITEACAEAFRKKLRDTFKAIDTAGREKAGRQAWNIEIEKEQRLRLRPVIYDDMSIEVACEWLCWAHAGGHWHTSPHDKIAWAIMEQKRAAQRSKVFGPGHRDHWAGP